MDLEEEKLWQKFTIQKAEKAKEISVLCLVYIFAILDFCTSRFPIFFSLKYLNLFFSQRNPFEKEDTLYDISCNQMALHPMYFT